MSGTELGAPNNIAKHRAYHTPRHTFLLSPPGSQVSVEFVSVFLRVFFIVLTGGARQRGSDKRQKA